MADAAGADSAVPPLHVVEVGNYIAGPFTATLLAGTSTRPRLT
jgi:hypothetical protein